MNPQLLVRPGINDHVVVEELLAPSATTVLVPGDSRGPIDRLVADAHIARKRPQLAVAAASAGIPYLIDPLTHFWQTDLRDTDQLAALPFGSQHAKVAQDFIDPLRRESLIASVVDFQLDHGATELIAPYLYVRSPDDPWFRYALGLLEATKRRIDRIGLHLPVLAVLAAGHQGFAPPSKWTAGIDRFARHVKDLGISAAAVCLSPITPRDGYGKVLATFAATARVRQISQVSTFAWRDGIYGAGLTAAGVDGYETGIATSEACDATRSLASRRPGSKKKGRGGSSPGIFIDPLGRSVPSGIGKVLLASALRARVMCDDERCCPDGTVSTIAKPRQHAIRMRARQLRAQEALPHPTWRLHQLAKDASAGSTVVQQANQVLEAAGMKERLPASGLDAVAAVARHLLAEATAEAA